MEKLDFSSLILGFSSAALTYLEGPEASEQTLELARQNIDIIELLDEKTRSNQTPPESQLLAEVQRDLKMRYAQAVHRAGIAIKK